MSANDSPTQAEEAVDTAEALRNALLDYCSCGAEIEADTYRGEPIDYELKAAINGWQEWTPAAATQFIADCRDAASSDIQNQWWKALQAVGTGADGGRC